MAVPNNLQMKNNQFRSNAISRRAVGQTEAQSCQSGPLVAQTKSEDGRARREWRGMERSLGGEKRRAGEGQRKRKEPGYKDDGWGRGRARILCSDIAGLDPGELDINSPCQSAFNTQGHLTLRGEAAVGHTGPSMSTSGDFHKLRTEEGQSNLLV